MRFVGPAIRFAFGAVFGALLGLRLVVKSQDPVVFFGGIAVCGVIGGLLCGSYGIRFWKAVSNLLWWVPYRAHALERRVDGEFQVPEFPVPEFGKLRFLSSEFHSANRNAPELATWNRELGTVIPTLELRTSELGNSHGVHEALA